MTNSKEAKARIKINKLLQESGWRFFDDEKGQANIQVEPNVKMTHICYHYIESISHQFDTIELLKL